MVARFVRDEEVAGSNPVTPTMSSQACISLATIFMFRKKSSRAHRAAPPFRKRSRARRLFACKRAHDGFGSLPTFCGDAGQLHLFRSTLPVRVSIWTLGFLFLQFRYEHRYHDGVTKKMSLHFFQYSCGFAGFLEQKPKNRFTVDVQPVNRS